MNMYCKRRFVRIASLLWLTAIQMDSLQATVSVTSSANSGTGTLRDAIDSINTGSTSPISLDVGINPVITSAMDQSTVSASITSADSPTAHTITGGGNVVLNVATGVTVSVDSSITFLTANLLVSGGTIQLNAAPTGIVDIQMSGTAPVLQFSTTTTGTLSSTVELYGTSSNTFTVDSGVTTTVTGIISVGSLTKNGGGTLILSQDNLYSSTFLSGGTIEVTTNTGLGLGPLTFSSSSVLIVDPSLTIANSVTLTGNATIQVTSGSAEMTGAFSGTGALTVSGGGELVLTGANNYTGYTAVASGTTLTVVSSGTLGGSNSSYVSVSGTLDISGTTSGLSIDNLTGASTGIVALGARSLTVNQTVSNVFAGTISGTGNFSLSTTSTAILSLSGVNTYTGSTTINAGTLALSGTGAIAASSSVTVSGTLDISATSAGATINTLSGSGSIVLGSQDLTIKQLSNGTLSGVVSGVNGGLILDASSTQTLTLSGVNTYTGPTLISGGTLALSGSGSISTSSSVEVNGSFSIAETSAGASIETLSGSGSVLLGSQTLTITQLAPGTFSGVISGSGGGVSLSSSSTNILTFTGVNTFTGATNVAAASLALSDSGSIASSSSVTLTTPGSLDISGVTTTGGATIQTLSGSGNITLGSNTLTVIQNSAGTYSGVISGSGGFNLGISAGKLFFTSVNTYSGPTVIETGVLSLIGIGSISSSSSVQVDGTLSIVQSAGGSTIHTLSGSGNIVLGTQTLIVIQDVSGAFSGLILGTTGNLIKEGSETLILTGLNAYSGTTLISAGTLEGSSDSLTSNITNNASLIFNQTTDGVYDFSISGTGTMEKTGAGILSLDKASSLSGVTTVSEGTLVINDSLVNSPIVVSAGGTLGGIGTTASITNSGTLNPGHPSGTLHTNGDVTFSSGSIYQVSIDGSGVSELVATGNVVIGGGTTFNINALDGFFLETETPKIVMEAADITGVFSQITSNSQWVTGSLVYSNTQIELFLQLENFGDLGFSGNSEQVGLAIDTIIAENNTAVNDIVISLLSLDDVQINAALNQMQPALFKGMAIVQESNAISVQGALDKRIQKEIAVSRCHPISNKEKGRCGSIARTLRLWGTGMGDHLYQDSNTYASSPQVGYQNNMGGFVLGFDGHFSSCCYFGGLGGYANSHMRWQESQSKGNIQTGYTGLYFSAIEDLWYVNTSVIGGWSSYQSSRSIIYPGVSKVANNSHGGSQVLAHIDTGLNIEWKGGAIRPFDSFNYVSSTEKAFIETGAGEFNLSVDSSRTTLLRNELGAQCMGCFCWRSTRWTIQPKLGWIYEARSGDKGYTASFVNTNVPFTVIGYFTNRNLLSTGLSLTANIWQDRLTVNLYYDGEFGVGYRNQHYGLQMHWGF